jgi:segregation and condensation protein A
VNTESYQITLPQFEGPFDLLLFFIERDELDIYNIPITKITNEFLDFIHNSETLNIELGSEFILFVSTLMRIKAKMLLPRKELDEQGNEIDPRSELVNKILEYKKFKQAAMEMSVLEVLRMQAAKRGNLKQDLYKIGEDAGEGTEIQTVTLYKLMRAFERVAQRLHEKRHQPVHTVVQYSYTMEGSREYMLKIMEEKRSLPFEQIFENCENRIHAIFLFLNMLELIQQRYLTIITGEGRNNFILEFNEDRREDEVAVA